MGRKDSLPNTLAYECYLTGFQLEEALQARQAAWRIWRQLDRVDKVGHTLRWLSRISFSLRKSKGVPSWNGVCGSP
jgi:hypothetical protein